ncbi:MAG: GGDEF domain-containing protein [Gammaproteobacteria bacterium]|nr:GGDEF domain-containing protein [Gammaproteobacteria bacterium]
MEAALVLTPWALLLVLSLTETPLLSGRGLGVVALLATFTLLAWLLPPAIWDQLWAWERWPASWIPGGMRAAVAWPMPGLSAWVAAVGLLWAGWRLWQRSDPVDGGLLVALAVAGCLPSLVLVGMSPWPWLLGAGVALLVSAGYASYRMAFLDALTGLPGRRLLDEQLARMGRHYALAMVDVDHFKPFNDRYGHDVGDQVLKLVASLLRRHFGRRAYRYGGEEFTVVFSGRSRRRAEERCEAFREAVAARELVLRSADRPPSKRQGKAKAGKAPPRKTVSVTLSIGLAEREPAQRSAEMVLKRADEALYAAKQAGRNRVAVAGRKPAKGRRKRAGKD